MASSALPPVAELPRDGRSNVPRMLYLHRGCGWLAVRDVRAWAGAKRATQALERADWTVESGEAMQRRAAQGTAQAHKSTSAQSKEQRANSTAAASIAADSRAPDKSQHKSLTARHQELPSSHAWLSASYPCA
eukprot:1660345-Rhodomonas_salina.1